MYCLLYSRLKFIRDHPDDVEIVDISDVWMNDVVRVSLSGDTSNAVVFKYAPPFVKVCFSVTVSSGQICFGDNYR